MRGITKRARNFIVGSVLLTPAAGDGLACGIGMLLMSDCCDGAAGVGEAAGIFMPGMFSIRV